MSKKDTAFQELITVAKLHPELFDQGGLETSKVARLLKTRSARDLAKGLDAAALVCADGTVEPLRLCYGGTKPPCKVMTLVYGTLEPQRLCYGGTKPPCKVMTLVYAEKAA